MKTFAIAKMIVVNNDGKFLVLRRSATDTRRPNQWDLPGGLVEDGDNIMATAIRETLEETEIEIMKCELVYAFSDHEEEFGSGTWTFFLSRVNEDAVTISNEHDDSRWMNIDEALRQFEYKRHLKALNYIKENHLLA